jgi:hypothetical protein
VRPTGLQHSNSHFGILPMGAVAVGLSRQGFAAGLSRRGRGCRR